MFTSQLFTQFVYTVTLYHAQLTTHFLFQNPKQTKMTTKRCARLIMLKEVYFLQIIFTCICFFKAVPGL